MKVFQIYYKQEQLAKLDPAFEPLSNIDNPRPDLQEWYIWNEQYKKLADSNLDYWGFVSWKFTDKMGITGKQMTDYVIDNPGYDLYLFNPAIINEAVYANGWEQGDTWHPNLSNIVNSFLDKIGVEDHNVLEVLLDRTRMGFATFFVANRKFWDGYMEFTNKIFTEADKDTEFSHQVFGAGLSEYNLNKALPNFPFINERLVSTYLELQGLNVLPFKHSIYTIPPKYKPYIADITALSELKTLINRYESDELYAIWNHYRQQFLTNNRGILSLE
jgi:hypothetical protein